MTHRRWHCRHRAATFVVALGLLVLGAVSAPAVADDSGDLPSGLSEVDGGDKADDATVVSAGRMLDHTSSSDSQNIYALRRTIPGSTVMFGVTLLSGDREVTKGKLRATLAYKLDDGSVVQCGRTVYDRDGRTTSMPLGTHAGYSTQRADCATHTDLFLVVYNNPRSGLDEGVPYELDLWEVPPLTNAEKLPVTGFGSAEAFSPGEATVEAAPGAWMAEATTLPPDETVRVDLPVGRTSWFAVDVPFNHLLDAFASVTDPDGTQPGAAVELRIVSPVGGIIGVPTVEDDRYRPTATLGDGPAVVESRSWLVSPRSRLDYEPGDEFNSEGTLAAQPGTYYIAVYVGNVSGTADATVPMTLTPALLKGTGAFEKGQDPKFTADVADFPAPQGAQAQPVGAGDAADAAEGPADPAGSSPVVDDGGDSSTTTLVAGLVGAATFFAVVGVVLLIRGRRNRTA